MARMYPRRFPVDPTRAVRDAEQTAFKALSRLPDDVFVFYQPRIPRTGANALEPDFVVGIPDVALIVLEAKNWTGAVSSSGDEVTVVRRDGSQLRVKHPLSQANQYAYALIDHLRNSSGLCAADGRISFPVLSAVLWLARDPGGRDAISRALNTLEVERIITAEAMDDPERLLQDLKAIPSPFQPAAGALSGSQLEAIAHALRLDENPLADVGAKLHELAELHAPLRTLAMRLEDRSTVDRLDRSVAELRTPSFNVAVFGCFSSGKSTVLNALVPGLHLPTGATPTTGVTTAISAGGLSASVTYRTTAEIERARSLSTCTLDPRFAKAGKTLQLATIEDGYGLLAGHDEAPYIKRVALSVPTVALPHGVQFVDLPGTDSMEVLHRMTAEEFIQLADAIVFVINATHSLGESDHEILQALARAGRLGVSERLIFFVNWLDRVQSRAGVIARVRSELCEEYGFEAPTVLSGVARLGELGRLPRLDEEEAEDGKRMVRRLGSPEAAPSAWYTVSGVETLERAICEVIALQRVPLFLLGRGHVLAEAHRALAQQIDGVLRSLGNAEAPSELEGLRARRAAVDREVAVARSALERRTSEAKALIMAELQTADRLAKEMVAALPGDFQPDDESVKLRLRDLQQAWMDQVLRNVSESILPDLERGYAEIFQRLQRRVWQSDESWGAVPVAASTSPMMRNVPFARDVTIAVSVSGGALTAIVMGAVAGSIFPGVGNLLGAVFGGLSFGLGIFRLSKWWLRREREQSVKEHCAELVNHLATPLDQLLAGFQQTATAYLDEQAGRFDQWSRSVEKSLAGSVAEIAERRVMFTAMKAELENSWRKIERFLDGAGLRGWGDQPEALVPMSPE